MTLASDPTTATRARPLAPVLFTLTIFTSALLLFFVQPLFTRLVLPQIGGAPAVWTTAMLFFQTVLIGGYVYAHVLTRYLAPTVQLATHLALCGLAIVSLPLAVPADLRFAPGTAMVTQTLWIFVLGVGLPFAALSATAPLLQSWYSRTGGPSAHDPYFLYSASNLGSLIALLAFPLVAEPLFGLSAISAGWSAVFIGLAGLLFLSGLMARGPHMTGPPVTAAASDAEAPAFWTIGYWAFLAFIPSSLMLGVTSKISVDLGAIPLVWVIPLSLYLFTFVLSFSAQSRLTSGVLRQGLAVTCAALALCALMPLLSWPATALMIACFFTISLVAHRLLYEARPDPRYLTFFYIVMSVGGAMGGILNSIVAPVIFDRYLELPLTVALAALLALTGTPQNRVRDISVGVSVAIIAMLPLVTLFPWQETLTVGTRYAASGVIVAVSFWFLRKRGHAGATAVCALIATALYLTKIDHILQDRSFFGAHVVREEGALRLYSNGTTVHGAQRIADFGQRPDPLFYYHRNGTMARILTSDRGRTAETVGIIGLGVGSLACYGQPGQARHFYEIDQKVIDIALDPQLFSFMSECGKDAQIHIGDARIVLQGQSDLRHDILIVDAYSSDAVPVHLATTEALQLYRDRLAHGGLLVFHVSNRYYDLAIPLSASAAALGIEARIRTHSADAAAVADGDTGSTVIALAETPEGLGGIATDPSWKPLPDTDALPWTDDHADLLSILR